MNINVIFFFLLPSSPAEDGDVPLRDREKKVRPFSMFDTVDQSAAPPSFGALRKNQSSEDILRDAQVLENTPGLKFSGNSKCIEGEQGKKPDTSGRLGGVTHPAVTSSVSSGCRTVVGNG